MELSIRKRWEDFVADLVAEGRYESSSDVVRDGLRLIQEREAKLRALRVKLDAAIAEGGEVGPEEVSTALDARARGLRVRGDRSKAAVYGQESWGGESS